MPLIATDWTQMTRACRTPAVVLLMTYAASTAAFAQVFELSSSHEPNSELRPGFYACRSGLDFDTFTWSFDLEANGSYILRDVGGSGVMKVSSEDGGLTILGGPFASDETAATFAMNTTRLSDGNSVIIIRYDFGSTYTDDFCAHVEE